MSEQSRDIGFTTERSDSTEGISHDHTYGVEEAVREIGISIRTLNTWHKHHLLTCVRDGRKRLFTGLMVLKGRRLVEYSHVFRQKMGKDPTTIDLSHFATSVNIFEPYIG